MKYITPADKAPVCRCMQCTLEWADQHPGELKENNKHAFFDSTNKHALIEATK